VTEKQKEAHFAEAHKRVTQKLIFLDSKETQDAANALTHRVDAVLDREKEYLVVMALANLLMDIIKRCCGEEQAAILWGTFETYFASLQDGRWLGSTSGSEAN
jgi:hypothetical protein